MPTWMLELATSDWLLAAFLVGVLIFLLDYGVFSPWWRHPIGYITIAFNLSVLLLMALIVYGVVAGQRVDEWVRIPVAFLLVIGIIGKIIVLHVSRHEGRIERRRIRHENKEK